MPGPWDNIDVDALLANAADRDIPVLALRAVMRTLPALTPRLRPEAAQRWSKEVLALFRALFVADAVQRHGGSPDADPKKLAKLSKALEDAADALKIARISIGDAGPAVFAKLAAAAQAVLTSMTTAGADRRRAAAEAIHIAHSVSPWLDEELIAFKLDDSHATAARGPFAVARRPLWGDRYPAEAVTAQRLFLTAVIGFPWRWTIWARWYSARLRGVPGCGFGCVAEGRDADLAIATLTADEWAGEAHMVNARIARMSHALVGIDAVIAPLVTFDGKRFDIVPDLGDNPDPDLLRILSSMASDVETLAEGHAEDVADGQRNLASLLAAYQGELARPADERSAGTIASLLDLVDLAVPRPESSAADEALGRLKDSHKLLVQRWSAGFEPGNVAQHTVPDMRELGASAALVAASLNKVSDDFSKRLLTVLLTQTQAIEALAKVLAADPHRTRAYVGLGQRLASKTMRFALFLLNLAGTAATLSGTHADQVSWENVRHTLEAVLRLVAPGWGSSGS
jgi:hypothetical protein